MSSNDLFDAISHPLRIEILKELSKKPKRFAEIKRTLKIESTHRILDRNVNLKGLYVMLIQNPTQAPPARKQTYGGRKSECCLHS